MHLQLLSLSVLLICCHGYPSGAPDSACADMVPRHGYQAQTTIPPFTLLVMSNTLTNENSIQVILATNQTFKGYLVRAVYADNPQEYFIDSTFYGLNDSSVTCLNKDGVTHSDNSVKESVSFFWKPKSSTVARIKFIATVVQEFKTFWLNLTSDPVDVNITVPQYTTTPPESTIIPTTEQPSESPKCEKGRGCFKIGCTNTDSDCDAVVMWNRVDNDFVKFDILSKIMAGTNRWTAIGFSKTGKMPDASVIMCYFQQNAKVEVGYTTKEYTYAPLEKDAVDLSQVHVILDGNVEKCSFLRRINETSNDDNYYSLSEALYLLLGTGKIENGIPVQHENTPYCSNTLVNFLTTENINGDVKSPLYIKIHGSLMIAAWILCSSIGVIVARYFKNEWPNTKPNGIKMWFHIHRTLMAIVFFATASSFILVFVEESGYVNIIAPSDKKYISTHPILGIAVMALTVVNPVMAFFRPDHSHPNRHLFHWSHMLVGISAHALAGITIYFGLNLPEANTSDIASDVMIGYAITFIVIEFILELHRQCVKSQQDDQLLKPLLFSSSANKGENGKIKSNSFRMAVLTLHVICMIGFTSSLIYYVVSA